MYIYRHPVLISIINHSFQSFFLLLITVTFLLPNLCFNFYFSVFFSLHPLAFENPWQYKNRTICTWISLINGLIIIINIMKKDNLFPFCTRRIWLPKWYDYFVIMKFILNCLKFDFYSTEGEDFVQPRDARVRTTARGMLVLLHHSHNPHLPK